jgi:hypothetical protein
VSPRAGRKGVTYDQVLALAAKLPGVFESTSYGTPALKVGPLPKKPNAKRTGASMTRLWEDGDVLVVKVPLEMQEVLLAADPEVFFLTDHYAGYPAILVRLSRVTLEQMEDLLEQSFRFVAPPKLVLSFEARRA